MKTLVWDNIRQLIVDFYQVFSTILFLSATNRESVASNGCELFGWLLRFVALIVINK